MTTEFQYFDIFIAGPMGDPRDDGAGVPFSYHIRNIHEALKPIAARIERDSPGVKVRLRDPEKVLTGSISNAIFEQILYSEMGVLDLSARSPAVMYELALFDALNIPVIMITFEHLKNEIPFYQKPLYCTIVDDFRTSELQTKLEPQFEALLRRTKDDESGTLSLSALKNNVGLNPLTQFFGLPLIDASATSGLATGYFYNFLQYITDVRTQVLKKAGLSPCLTVLRPHDLDDVERLRPALDEAADTLGLSVEFVDIKDLQHPRGVRVGVLGGLAFDIPTTLSAQRSSPLNAILALKLQLGSGDLKAEIAALSKSRQERNIERFFDVLSTLVSMGHGASSDQYRVMNLDAFLHEVAGANGGAYPPEPPASG